MKNMLDNRNGLICLVILNAVAMFYLCGMPKAYTNKHHFFELEIQPHGVITEAYMSRQPVQRCLSIHIPRNIKTRLTK